jgi:tetratricopeptide (TPR) repeat protein
MTVRLATPHCHRHTSVVRAAATIVALLLSAHGAAAEVMDIPAAPAADPDRGNFWRDMLWPHKDEVDSILLKVQQAITNADMGLYADYDPSGLERLRFYREMFGPIRHARKLAPDNVDVLRNYAIVADELGKTREAMDALHAAIDLVGTEKAGGEITGRLGMIYLRLGKVDDAIRYLRTAQGPIYGGRTTTAHVIVHLAHALASQGQMSEAIDVLSNALPANIQYYANEIALASLALAVHYDRDEQRGAAFDILDRMQSGLQGQLGTLGFAALATMRFTPAADRHYYYGLLYEAVGNITEARTEFALYASSGESPYRRRALEHVTALDVLRRSPPPLATPAAPTSPTPVPRRYRRVP